MSKSDEMMNVTFRMNKQDKLEFERIIHTMGLNLSSAFNVFAKAVIHENKLPFTIRGAKVPNEATKRAIENVEKGENLEEFTIEQLKEEYAELKKKWGRE
ncbi:type II toxin-antitoxin system RelB/DinJ family antitoxin [uncultured Helicobacter sp.]|uniref:type II toxin-antitoxin system RelB/DinJ family antitoxin n=1 Tax=uncultured Helicobacter sp. TaxID=175537 RepID=UPI001C3A9B6A|nr:type II toxin-antitoxin system RelB/DinJ family antitoxin [Candidatus Helicobacter avicola]